MDLETYLAGADAAYDADARMIGHAFNGPGYHSTMPQGARVHETRGSLQYALGLLQAGSAERAERAAAIIARVLTLQDTDPVSRTYGIWPWLLEEPLDRMNPPDWNWADFCGARIAMMVAGHANRLPGALVGEMRAALGHAAGAIYRRNITLDYTNIAIMGAGVAAAAGELLEEPRLLNYARRRLQGVVERVAWHDTFPEYNSPTYTIVAVQECDRILHLVKDAATRDAAESLRQSAWRLIAEHFHAGARQWAGPHARTYSDHLRPLMVDYLSKATGAAIGVHPLTADSAVGEYNLVPVVPCPDQWCSRFTDPPERPTELRRRFVHLTSGDDRIGTTWMTRDATLGSINHEDLWNQRRAVLGYWSTPQDPAVVLRLRFLMDGRDLASAHVRASQSGPRVLTAVTMLTDRGIGHPWFDHPKDDRFMAEDLRLSWELTGTGVRAEQLDNDRFALTAGGYRAIIHAATATFGPHAAQWQVSQEPDRACIQAVCHHGSREGFDFRTFPPVILVSAVELVETDAPPTTEAIAITRPDEETFRAQWCDLHVAFPAGAHTYPQ